MRTRYREASYALGVMGDEGKRERRRRVEERIRAHIRAAMVENGIGLVAAASKLDEDKGALSAVLSGGPKPRSPSAYLTFMVQVAFDISAKALLNVDPDAKYFDPAILGTIVKRPRAYAEKPGPSAASRAPAVPSAKRSTHK